MLDDLEEGSGYDNSGSPYSDNRTHSEQLMKGLSDDQEEPEYEREYEYVEMEEDEGELRGYAGCPKMYSCICTFWTASGPLGIRLQRFGLCRLSKVAL